MENIPVDERQSVCIDELMAVARVRLTEMIVNDEIAVMDENIADADSELTAVADANYMAFALQQLRLMDLDETGMSPKYAVVFGTLTVTGWSKENGYWYYYDENGSKVYGWLNLIESGTSYWYYLDPTNSGRMVTGRKTLYTGTEARLYYFTANGPMAHGWYRLDLYNTGDNYYYYFGVPGNPDTGYMRKGWLEDQDGKWYYLSTDDGHMLAGILFTDSNNDLYYLAADGHMVTEQWYSNYYFKSSGIAARSEFLTVGSNRYYFGDNRRTVKGWFVINSKTYHADPTTGIMTRGTSYLGSPYVRSTFNSTTGEWMSDTLITKTASDHGYPYNLRWKYLQVANGKRGPVLKVNYDGVSQQYRPYLEQAIDAYNNDPDLFVTIEVVAESAANLRIYSGLSTDDINENAGFTRCYDSQGNEFCPEYVTGEIASSDIYIYELYIDTQHLKGLFMHEIGHVLGLRHTYEPSNGQTDPGTVALMHPGNGHINARDSFQDYDYQQYQYTYPERGINMNRFISLLCVLCFLIFTGGCAKSEELERHVYTEEEVAAFIRYDGANACIPAGLEDIMVHRMALVTLVMEGTVLDDGTEVELLPDGEYIKIPADMTLFQVRVEEIWFGKADGKTITVGYAGKHDERVSKPQKGDRVILFLKKSLVGDYYGMSGRMEQTYILNPPDDRLIALHTSHGRDKWPTFSKEDVRQEMEECLQRFVDGTTEYRYENKVLKRYIDSCRRKEKLQSMLPWNWE